MENIAGNKANDKALQWQEWLSKKNITCFAPENLADERNTVLFHTNLEVKGQNLLMIIQTDDTLCMMIQVLVISGAIHDGNRLLILNKMNESNKKYRVFKYLINEDKLELHCCIFGKDEDFDPQTVHIAIDWILQHLIEEYSNWMKLVWSN